MRDAPVKTVRCIDRRGRVTMLIRRRVIAALVMALAAAVAGGGAIVYREAGRLGPLSLDAAAERSVTVVDRNGALLRAYTTADGRWRLPVSHKHVDQRYLRLLLAFEDKRFHQHAGVDFLALLRAGLQFITHGRIVSGGSTLTMQTARLLDGRHERTAVGKLRQIIRAVQLERKLGKSDILDLYLRLAPFGGNIEGVRAASLAYFGKEPRRLSLGQAALLVALPQAPETRRPDRAAGHARAARQRVLARAVDAGLISLPEAERAAEEAVPNRRIEFPKLAPHLADFEVKRAADQTVHRLTIDRHLQARLERLVRQHVENLASRLSAALMVIDNASAEVLARVGSAGLFDDQRFGAVDMTRVLRSPGSALKPVVYGLAFEMGLAHPETLIDDRPVRFGTYAPKNFDKRYRGTVRIREALSQSLNVPAVKVLDAVGPGRFVGRLRRAGIPTQLPEGAEPSLAVALGGIAIRLDDMARLYLALARGGTAGRLKQHVSGAGRQLPGAATATRPSPLMSETAAFYVTSVLKDAPPPDHARAGQIAYKTGTSYGYRDAWAAGFDGKHTVVVWVGRPDAAATPGLTGRTAAAPILFDTFQRIAPRRAPLMPAPRSAILRRGSGLPEPLKRFERARTAARSGAFLTRPLRIAFPPDRADVEVGGPDTAVVLKASGGELPLTWFADGAPIAARQRTRQFIWSDARSGFIRLSVVDAKGRTDRVMVRLHKLRHYGLAESAGTIPRPRPAAQSQ